MEGLSSEAERLEALRSYEIMDSEPEPTFDGIVQLAASMTGTPMAAISLLDEARQWFKARVGLEVEETPREIAFCDHTIRSSEPMVVADATADERFSDNPLVREAPGIRFYAGVPIHGGPGARLGTLCVLDRKPRSMPPEHMEALRLLAQQVELLLATRRKERALVSELQRCVRENDVLASVVEKAPVMMFAKAWPSLNVTFWNSAAERITGVPRDSLVGRTGMESFPRHEMEAFLERDRKVLTEGVEVEVVETVTGPRGPRTLRTRKIPVTGTDGPFLLGISEDITDLRAREAELDELNQGLEERVEERSRQLLDLEEQLHQARRLEALGRLAGGVAHDFNNLLTVILGYSELLARDKSLSEDVRRDMADVADAGARAARLTQQLLAFGRRQVRRPVPVNLGTEVREALPLLRRMISSTIDIVVVEEPGRLVVEADRAQLEQVLTNLVVNAADALPNGGRITLRIFSLADGEAATDGFLAEPVVGLAVEDDGVGMTAEVRARIFEPFYSTKKEARGTGLGLATVFGIIQQSDGYIDVDSELGKGTTVRVYFPAELERTAFPSSAPGAEPLEVPRRSDRTLLVVDDDESVRGFVSRVLREAGYQVREAASPGDALLECEGRLDQIDLLVSDLAMPRITGVELARRLRVERPDLPCIFMSGYASDGAPIPETDSLVPKPVSPAELLNAVALVLAEP
ncbi:MAG: hypothetical protein CMN30_16385 [Sandaracinus sp.]|nr:hypothetical protein [Sandaracinus sp.]